MSTRDSSGSQPHTDGVLFSLAPTGPALNRSVYGAPGVPKRYGLTTQEAPPSTPGSIPQIRLINGLWVSGPNTSAPDGAETSASRRLVTLI